MKKKSMRVLKVMCSKLAVVCSMLLFAQLLAAKALDRKSPEDNIKAWVRLTADINGKVMYKFGPLMAYGIPEGEVSRKLFQLISLTKTGYRKLSNGDYQSKTSGCGLYADAHTGEFIDQYTNPYNNKTIKLKPYCSNVSGSTYSAKTGMTTKANFTMESSIHNRPYVLEWNVMGDIATVTREARTKWLEKSTGKTKYETSVDTYVAKLSDLNNPSLSSVDATYQYTLNTEWMSMLKMSDMPGHMLWVGNYTKHADLSEIPVSFIRALEQRVGKDYMSKPLWDDKVKGGK